jgi:pyruvate/2-oxoglutarate dehydrogenase complex dihydrolipoamide acyltransferase (E2) component
MTVPIRIPEDLWDDDGEAVIVAWLYDDGARVQKDCVVATLGLEKAQIEITAPESGILVQQCAAESPVARGAVIGEIRDA